MLDISRKLASLLAILSGHQGKGILSVILSDIRNNTIEENFQTIRIGDKLKTICIKFKFAIYENANVCPMKLFK